jgi:hypothetical protein
VGGKPWYRRDPERLEHVREVAERLQPELDLVVEDGTVYLRGTFLVYHDGRVWDRYEVEIEFPHDYDRQLAAVREVGGRIPHEAKFHTYRSGKACLFLEDEFWWEHPDGVSFETFLGEIVASYFLSQTHFREFEEEGWLFGDRDHNERGVIDFYAEKFGTDDEAAILRYLDYLQRGAKGHWKCPCGSGKKLRKCHGPAFRKAQDRISPEVARLSRARIYWARRQRKTGAAG